MAAIKHFLLGFFLIAFLQIQANDLSVDFGMDTLHACMWEPVELSPTQSGGIGTVTFTWNTGDSTASIEIVPNQVVEMIIVVVTDQNNQQATDTLIIHGFPECVWPGDANGDGQANNEDLLALGHSYGATGQSRINPHFNWIGQPAPAWQHTLTNGVNYVHSDIDGDGMVVGADIAGINHNYFVPQTDTGLSATSLIGTSLFLDIPTSNYLPGDTIVIPIILGTPADPADSVYGLAFSITFDPSQIDSSYFDVDFSNSWLGTEGQDMITLDRAFFSQGQIDIALTRIDHAPIPGQGRIGDITVVIDDLILKKEEETMNIGLGIKHVSLIDEAGDGKDVLLDPTQISIVLSNEEDDLNVPIFTAFPSPASELLSIEIENLVQEGTVILFDQYGRTLVEETVMRERKWTIDVSHLPVGAYFLQLQTAQAIKTQKIWIQ